MKKLPAALYWLNSGRLFFTIKKNNIIGSKIRWQNGNSLRCNTVLKPPCFFCFFNLWTSVLTGNSSYTSRKSPKHNVISKDNFDVKCLPFFFNLFFYWLQPWPYEVISNPNEIMPRFS
jgi:hypothetical protein